MYIISLNFFQQLTVFFVIVFNRDLQIPSSSLRDKLALDYQRELYKILKSKERGMLSPWVWHRLRSGDTVYLHLQKHSYSWQIPEDFDVSLSKYLSTQDLMEVVERVNQDVEKDQQFMTSLNPLFVKFHVTFHF